MFRNMSDEGRLMGGRSPSSMPGRDSQERSWIEVLSRPAKALVEKFRNRTLKSSLVTEESEFLSPLEGVQLGPPHLSYLQCEPRSAGAMPWLSADSLREIRLQSGAEVDLSLCQQTQFRYLSSFRAVLGHVLLSSQEVKVPGGQSWSSRPWCHSFWGGKEGLEMGQLSRGMLGENAGAGDHKEQPVNNGSLPIVQNTVENSLVSELSIRDPQHCSGATTAKASPVTPEQDNGYSSLEEEHLSGVTSTRPELPPQETEEVVLSVPQCQNKTINFIMGGPCSEDEDSQSEESFSDDDDDDDDGFDSEGSSEMSDGTDDDDGDEDDESEAELEAERLLRSLCHSEDPYDPRNFTACLHTGATTPRSVPASTLPSSAHSSPSPSPPSSLDTWDDSASASEADEESLRLWDSFSSSSDPFNLLNFQAPIRTHESVMARAVQTSTYYRFHQECPPEYRKEEAEDRLDSGFCDTSARNCSSTKKVHFCDDVEEFFTSCGEEDRRGPWEELARDRCRFLRRCQEVEESIAYCLQPQHRRRVYERLAALPR